MDDSRIAFGQDLPDEKPEDTRIKSGEPETAQPDPTPAEVNKLEIQYSTAAFRNAILTGGRVGPEIGQIAHVLGESLPGQVDSRTCGFRRAAFLHRLVNGYPTDHQQVEKEITQQFLGGKRVGNEGVSASVEASYLRSQGIAVITTDQFRWQENQDPDTGPLAVALNGLYQGCVLAVNLPGENHSVTVYQALKMGDGYFVFTAYDPLQKESGGVRHLNERQFTVGEGKAVAEANVVYAVKVTQN